MEEKIGVSHVDETELREKERFLATECDTMRDKLR
jgi:hypothetical protein